MDVRCAVCSVCSVQCVLRDGRGQETQTRLGLCFQSAPRSCTPARPGTSLPSPATAAWIHYAADTGATRAELAPVRPLLRCVVSGIARGGHSLVATMLQQCTHTTQQHPPPHTMPQAPAHPLARPRPASQPLRCIYYSTSQPTVQLFFHCGLIRPWSRRTTCINNGGFCPSSTRRTACRKSGKKPQTAFYLL